MQRFQYDVPEVTGAAVMNTQTRRLPRDLGYVDVSQGSELLYWCDELDCSENVLRAVIGEVGPSVVEVKRRIGREPNVGAG
jgi:hypothetical protein